MGKTLEYNLAKATVRALLDEHNIPFVRLSCTTVLVKNGTQPWASWPRVTIHGCRPTHDEIRPVIAKARDQHKIVIAIDTRDAPPPQSQEDPGLAEAAQAFWRLLRETATFSSLPSRVSAVDMDDSTAFLKAGWYTEQDLRDVADSLRGASGWPAEAD